MYCNKCGNPLPDNSLFCNSCGASQTAQQAPNQAEYYHMDDKERKHYLRDSWILFAVCLIYGIIRTYAGFSSGEEINAYKGLIALAAALVFIPPIKVGVNNLVATLIIKILIVVAVIIII